MSARYTVVLRDLMANTESRDALEHALSTYPLFTPAKVYDLIPNRQQLNTRLLNHYKYREIGFETVGRFLDELEITMCEIMPRYNELFKSVATMADIENPFDNVDVVETYTEERTHSSTTTGSSETSQSGETSSETAVTGSESSTGAASQTANGKHVESGTPQDSLSIPAGGIDSVTYADKAQWNEDTLSSESSESTERNTSENVTGTASSEETGSSTANTESTDTVTHEFRKVGNQGVTTYARDMNEFRTSIIDVVNQIVTDDRVAELFMMVY